MGIRITGYEAVCNLGENISSIYERALNGDTTCFQNLDGYFKDGYIRAGVIKSELPVIEEPMFNLRCNRLILKTIGILSEKFTDFLAKYPKDRIAVIGATTNSGTEEFENSNLAEHYQLYNPARFLQKYLGLNGYCTTVSTACSSGIKAFSLGRDLIDSEYAEAFIVITVDSLAKVPIYGFHSLEVLTDKPLKPFCKNRCGMNMGEACSIFLVEKNTKNGIEIMGIGESSDIYHPTTPEPGGFEAVNAIKLALSDANISAEDIDYINAHGTGTLANDIMESNAIYKVFGNKTPVSSTKSMTGHCLGAASGIETALCCKLLDDFRGKLFPNTEDFDETLSPVKLVKNGEKYNKCNICMNNSFGFGGTNAIIILGKNNE